jgi:excisionase family DNA binding protein
MGNDENKALPISHVSKRLNVCYKTTRRIIASGELRAHRIRRQWRVFEVDLREYLAKTVNRKVA